MQIKEYTKMMPLELALLRQVQIQNPGKELSAVIDLYIKQRFEEVCI
jgi:hypothetical protein